MLKLKIRRCGYFEGHLDEKLIWPVAGSICCMKFTYSNVLMNNLSWFAFRMNKFEIHIATVIYISNHVFKVVSSLIPKRYRETVFDANDRIWRPLALRVVLSLTFDSEVILSLKKRKKKTNTWQWGWPRWRRPTNIWQWGWLRWRPHRPHGCFITNVWQWGYSIRFAKISSIFCVHEVTYIKIDHT